MRIVPNIKRRFWVKPIFTIELLKMRMNVFEFSFFNLYSSIHAGREPRILKMLSILIITALIDTALFLTHKMQSL